MTEKEKCLDCLKRLNGLPPYNSFMNFQCGDVYFCEYVYTHFSKELLAECKKELNL